MIISILPQWLQVLSHSLVYEQVLGSDFILLSQLSAKSSQTTATKRKY